MSADGRNEHGLGRSSKRPGIGDGTQGQEAEEMLCPSGERYRAFFNNAAVGMVEVEIATGRLLNVNDAMCRITGYSSNELLEKTFPEITHPDDRASNWADFQAAMRQEEPSYDVEKRFICKDGTAIWVRVHVSVVRDGQGEPVRAAAVVEDITERKEAEEALRESEARLEAELASAKQLQRVGTQLIREDSLSALDEQILDVAVALMDADMGSMQKYLPEREELQLLVWQGFDPEEAASRELITVESDSVCGEAMRRGERVIIEDVEACGFMAGTADLDFYRRSGIRAAQTTPLVSRRGHIVGMLTTHWRAPHAPDERDLHLLDVLARQAADLIDCLRVEEALKELNEELEERVEQRTEQVRALASALAEAEEKERERIADMLHDDVQQLLYGTELSLRALRRQADEIAREEARGELEERLGQLEEALDEAQEATRSLSAELSPPLLRDEGLEAALEWLAGHFEGCYGLTVELDLAEDFRLPDESMRRLLFQVARECLFNTVKHAEVEEARVEGRREKGALLLKVSDEGKGFDKEEVLEERPEGRGLRALQNRLELLGGDMHIDTAPGEGTHVTINVPTGAEGEG